MFRRKGCSVVGVDVGTVALRHFLVYALGMGDQPCGTVAGRDFLARAHNGRKRWVEAVAAVWLALGRCRADQYFSVVFSARFRVVGVVPARQARQTLARRSNSSLGCLRGMYHAMAGSQLPHF